jgi:hypothetical protein
MGAFNMKIVASDGNCLFRRLAILPENDESKYDAVRQKTVFMYVMKGINSKNVQYEQEMGQDELHVGHEIQQHQDITCFQK